MKKKKINWKFLNRNARGLNILRHVINSLSLHCSQIKDPPLHQGQLLHNSLLNNYLSNVLLLNLSSGMENKALEHISCPLSSRWEHRLHSLSLGLDRAGLSCHQADLKVCVCDTSPHPGSVGEGLRMSAGLKTRKRNSGKTNKTRDKSKVFNILLPLCFNLCQYTFIFTWIYSHHMWSTQMERTS